MTNVSEGEPDRRDIDRGSREPVNRRVAGRTLDQYQRDAARIAEVMGGPTRDLARSLEKMTLSSRDVERMTRSFRAIDSITPQLLRPMELGLSVKVADLLASSSLLAANRNAMVAQSRLVETLARPEWLRPMYRLIEGVQIDVGSDLAAMSMSIARLSSLQSLRLPAAVEASFAQTMRSWNAYSRQLLVPRTEIGLLWARSAGQSALGITAAVSTIGGAPEESRLAEPWENTPSAIRARTLARLDAVDGRLVPKLNGAWDRVRSPGPDGLSQAATSTIEFIDWFLRSTAPDAEVLEWHGREGRASNELHQGRPTRGLRVRFALRDREPDGRVAEAFVGTLLVIAKELQSMKHAEMGSDMSTLERLLPSVEAVVAFMVPDVP
jgi:hypothetical protein